MSKKVSWVLIAIATSIYTILNVTYYGWDPRAIPQFLYRFCLYSLPAAATFLLLWVWPFKKSKRFVFFCFSFVYFVLIMSRSVETFKDLNKMAKSVKELEYFDECFQECFQEQALLLKNKVYSREGYGDLSAVLTFKRDYQLFFQEEEACRQAADKELLEAHVFPPVSFNTKEDIIKARSSLEKFYNTIVSLQRRSINYNSNLLRIFREQGFKNNLLKEKFLKQFQPLIDTRITFANDFYNVLIYQAYVIDDLLLFLFNRLGFYTIDGTNVTFQSRVDTERYNYLLDEFNSLVKRDQEIIDWFNETPQN